MKGGEKKLFFYIKKMLYRLASTFQAGPSGLPKNKAMAVKIIEEIGLFFGQWVEMMSSRDETTGGYRAG
jgi:hypothetical protein